MKKNLNQSQTYSSTTLPHTFIINSTFILFMIFIHILKQSIWYISEHPLFLLSKISLGVTLFYNFCSITNFSFFKLIQFTFKFFHFSRARHTFLISLLGGFISYICFASSLATIFYISALFGFVYYGIQLIIDGIK